MSNNKHTTLELKQIAAQLRCPQGKEGTVMAEKMFRTNTDMLKQSLPYLSIKHNDQILEIGHGNCKHLNSILKQAEKVKYYGVEISKLMYQEAIKTNIKQIRTGKAYFFIYDGNNLPFPAQSFDRIITVNTIYFFDNPNSTINKIYALLKPKGIFVLTFQEKKFIETLPFTKYGFNIYTNAEIKKMLKKAGFKIIEEATKSESTISKIGDEVLRRYAIIKSAKP